ncbi:MAG: hypothetical protein KIT08_07650 [Anaerolineales bacterium]|nr:MAG: hypothetical protein KIT08_07650 [Anaerolineales bacterium]
MKRWAWLVIATLFTACAQPPSPATLPATPAGSAVLKGYGISPLGFPADFSQYPQFLEEVASLPNGAVMFNGAWRDSIDSSGQPPQAAAGLMLAAAQYGFTPIIVFGWRSSNAQLHLDLPSDPTNNWSNPGARSLFIEMLAGFATQHQPPYIFLGNESDDYFIAQPKDYLRWIEVYNQAYDAIKAASPGTQVGPIFQYERMAGLGVLNGWSEPHWGALDAHDMTKVDILGITLYPWFSASTPAEIPDGYLAPLLQRTGATPIAVTETGWPADTLGLQTPWEASPQVQVRYVEALARITSCAEIRILNWLFINPINALPDSLEVQLFGSISLRDADGEKRPVYDAWLNFSP